MEALLFEEKNKNSDLNKKIIKLEEIVNNKENELKQLRDEIIKNTSEVNDLYKKINKKNINSQKKNKKSLNFNIIKNIT